MVKKLALPFHNLYFRAQRGLRLMTLGLAMWIAGAVPPFVYVLVSRMLGQSEIGPGVIGIFGFFASVSAMIVVTVGFILWMLDSPAGRGADREVEVVTRRFTRSTAE